MTVLARHTYRVVAPAARWRVVAALLLSLVGLGVSTYLTVVHFLGVQDLVCSSSGIINCTAVTTSAESHILGIPVAVLGLAFYLVTTGCNLPMAWRSEDWRVHAARLVLAVGGMAFVLWLLYAELIKIGKICEWCSSVHFVTFLLFVLVLSTVPPMLGWGARADER